MKHLRILLTLAIAMAAAAPAKADTTVGTPILSVPVVISKPGKYRLTKSLVNTTSNPAILIVARDVALDLNGFSIFGTTNAEDDNVAIVVNGPNTIIRNGTIRRFFTAISDGPLASGTIVEDVICTSQTSSGILFVAQDVLLRRVIVRNIGIQSDDPDNVFGIRLSGSSVIENCLIQNIPFRPNITSNVGIRLTGGSHLIRETDVHRVAATAVSISADVSSIFEDLRVRECGTGLTVSGNQVPLLRETTIRDCTTSVLGTFDDGGRNNIDQ